MIGTTASRRSSRGFWIGTASALALLSPTVVHAQNSAEPVDELAEIVVTAQRREERLQDVPISISVLGGERLDAATAKGVTEALQRVPGVTVVEGFQTGGAQISVRGVAALNNISSGGSPIGYYVDSVPFGFVKTALAPDTSAYDLERVEVLRGPQGTLYGASAQNGVVRVLTHAADLDAFEGKARFAGSTTKDGGRNGRADLALNAPIIPGIVGARLVLGYQSLSGWIDKPTDKNSNDGRLYNARLRVTAKPTDELSADFTAWVSRNKLNGPSAGDDDRRSRAIIAEPIHNGFNLFGLKVAYDLPYAQVSSATSYIDYRLRSSMDGVFSTSGANILDTNLDANVFAEEVNINSTHEGPWRWSAGAIYRDASDRIYQLRHTMAGAPTGGYVLPSDSVNDSESYAVYGEVTRLFADDKIELTAGLRYFKDEVSVREISRQFGPPQNQPPSSNFAKPLVHTTRHFDAWSPRFVGTWHVSDDLTAYASYAEGFRSGADQSPQIIISAPTLPPVDADTIKNYEVGSKGNALDRRLSFDLALYHLKWVDVQQGLSVAFGTALLPAQINGTSASGWGIDAGVTLRPVERLTLDLAASYNDITQDEDVVSITAGGPAILTRKGERLPTPSTTVSFSFDYGFDLAADYEGTLSGGLSYVSEQTLFALSGTTRYLGVSDKLTLANLRFAVTSPQGWTATVFGDNLLDEGGATSRHPFARAVLNHREWASRVRPRTIGMQLDVAF